MNYWVIGLIIYFVGIIILVNTLEIISTDSLEDHAKVSILWPIGVLLFIIISPSMLISAIKEKYKKGE